MASVDDILGQLQAAGQKLAEGVHTLSVADQIAATLPTQMAVAGVQDKVAAFARTRESIQRTRQHLVVGQDLISQSISQAKAAGG